MPLRFDLAIGEKLYVGRGVITNGKARSMFVLEGNMPVLKEKDVITLEAARTTLDQLYRHLQQAYLYEQPATEFATFAVQAAAEAPEIYTSLTEVDALVAAGDLYRALKNLRRIIRARESVTMA